MSSGRDFLGPAHPASTGDGSEGRVGGYQLRNADGESAAAYHREWAAKGYKQTHTPDELKPQRETAPVRPFIPKQRQPVSTNEIFFEERVHNLFEGLEKTLLSKHKDYGPGNIAQAPGGALNGLRVRIHDKVARINHLLDSGQEPQHEALEDSFLDLANYAVIAILVLRKQWPAVK